MFGGLVAIIVGFYEHLKKRPIPWPTFKWGFITFLLVSFFVVWNGEHKKVSQLEESTKPKLVLQINNVVTAYSLETKGSFIFINLGVKNLGAPSIAYEWKLSAIGSNWRDEKILPTPIPDGFRIGKEGQTDIIAIFSESNRLEEKTMTPLQKGSLVNGWLRFDFPGKQREDLDNATKIVYVHDVLDNESSITFVKFERLRSSPGSGPDPFSRHK